MIRGFPVRPSLGHEDDDLVSCLIEDELQGSSVRKGIPELFGEPRTHPEGDSGGERPSSTRSEYRTRELSVGIVRRFGRVYQDALVVRVRPRTVDDRAKTIEVFVRGRPGPSRDRG